LVWWRWLALDLKGEEVTHMPFIALAIVAIVAITAIADRGGAIKLSPNGLELDIENPGALPEGA
jgi:hypothetical protein